MLTKFKEVVSVLHQTPKALQLVWRSSPIYTLFLGRLTLLQSVIPVCQVWIGKLIVDAIVGAVNQPGSQPLGPIAFLVSIERAKNFLFF